MKSLYATLRPLPKLTIAPELLYTGAFQDFLIVPVGAGSYREAIGELEAAHTLDPNAKDLVFNLGVVHEKLGDIDDALKWFRLYTTMNLTGPERDRADAYVHRLEGAKKELEDKQAAAAAARPKQSVGVV